MSTTQPIRDISHVRALTNYYLNLGQHRNHLLILFGLHTALRIGDLLTIRWRDVYDFGQKCPRKTLTIKEQKTGKNKTLALNAKIVKALKHSAGTAKPHEFLFANPHSGKAITRTQARRIIQAADSDIFRETLTDVAVIVGASYRHLLRCLGKLCDDGILIKEGNGYRIADRKALDTKAGDLYVLK